MLLPGPPVFTLHPRIRDREICLVCGAHLPVSTVQALVSRATSDSGLAVVLSRPPLINVLHLLGWEPRWYKALGDLDLWVTPGAYLGDLRPPR